MLVGPRSTKEEREAFRQRLLANPANYIAQTPLRCRPAPPSLMKGCRRGISIYGPTCCPGRRWLVPGGLTRVALTEGSLVVNSSQGGGTKDTG